MSALDQPRAQLTRRYGTSALTPALMFSLAAHATVGGLLVQYWRHAPLEPPQPLTVTLEVLPPVIVQSTPPPVAITQATPAPKSRALPAPPVHHAPMPNLIAMQRSEVAAPAFAVPVPET